MYIIYDALVLSVVIDLLVLTVLVLPYLKRTFWLFHAIVWAKYVANSFGLVVLNYGPACSSTDLFI
jgi:hypothetical protein